MENCIFCKIVAGEIPSPRFYEDGDMIVIKDIEPKAKLHYLCIPKTHFALLSEMDEEKAELLKRVMKKIPELANGVLGLSGGYRMIVNQGADGGQSVPHLHIHLLGGETLTGF
ncbi:MAG: histidine triad nucleotide-binding protein [Clostridia bacterium]|nr:histidine triad nucleotide-binding protein [Clostridia bacterium]